MPNRLRLQAIALSASLIAAASAGDASAGYMSGSITIKQAGLTVTCNIELADSLSTPPPPPPVFSTVVAAAFAPGDWLCGLAVYPATTGWTYTRTASFAVFDNVRITTLFGECRGTLTGSVTGGLINLSSNVVTGTPQACEISGTLVF